MDFIHAIRHLQQKPEHVRWQILVVSVMVGMALIVGGWLVAVNRRIGDIPLLPQAQTKQTQKTDSPFRMIKDVLENAASDIRAQF